MHGSRLDHVDLSVQSGNGGSWRIAVRAAEHLDGGLLTRPDPDRVGVFGSLMFNAASAAARQGAADRAEDLLAAACTDLKRWTEVAEHLDAARRLLRSGPGYSHWAGP